MMTPEQLKGTIRNIAKNKIPGRLYFENQPNSVYLQNRI